MPNLRERIDALLAAPTRELGRLQWFVRQQVELWTFCARRLHENNLAAMSAALSFRTIFAMIPVIVLLFLAAKTLGMLEDSKQSLRSFLDASGFSQIVALDEAAVEPTEEPPVEAETPDERAARVINVADEIESMVMRVEGKLTFERLGPIGGLLFVWTALTLLTTIEQSLNRIFGSTRGRTMTQRLLLYWSAVTLCPAALAGASYLGAVAVHAIEGWHVLGWLLALIGAGGPILVGIVVLAAVYKFLTNAPVRWRAALGGAAVAAVLWLAAKAGFTLYVNQLVLKGNLYGVLGVFPLFMLWLNLSWMIFLFGAELAHTTANLALLRSRERARRITAGPSDALAAALAVARPYSDGRGFATVDELAGVLGRPMETVRFLLDRLAAANLVAVVDGGPQERVALLRPPERVCAADIEEALDVNADDCDDAAIRAAVEQVRAARRAGLCGMTLAALLAGTPDAVRGTTAD